MSRHSLLLNADALEINKTVAINTLLKYEVFLSDRRFAYTSEIRNEWENFWERENTQAFSEKAPFVLT